MRQECWEPFPRRRLQRKPRVNDPGMHHGTCVKHVPRCMQGSLTCGAGENVPGIPGACATRNFAYLARGPLSPLLFFPSDHVKQRAEVHIDPNARFSDNRYDSKGRCHAKYDVIYVIIAINVCLAIL